MFVNRAYVEAVGMEPSQLLGRRIGESRGEDLWARHRPYYERAVGGEAADFTRLVDLPGRGARWVRTSYVPDFDADGRSSACTRSWSTCTT